MISITAILAACPVCAAGNESAASSGPVWALMLIAPAAIAAITGISVYLMWRRRP